jgi:adenylate cyclase
MVAAAASGNLSSLALDLRLRGGPLSARDVADLAGLDLDRTLEAYRLLGIPVPDPDERRFGPDEVALLELSGSARGILGDETTSEILRSVGAGMAIIAESAVTAFVGSVEDVLEAGDPLTRAETTMEAGELAATLGRQLAPLLRHHIVAATDRQRAAMVGAADRRSSTFAVGFVDLVGFTATTSSMTSDELLSFMQSFHARTYDAVTGPGGRVIKHIGDEIMFAAPSATVGCTIALDLVDAFADDAAPPRAGLVYGTVLARHGDLYGPVVNLAARLADVAVPGEVLADAAIAEVVSDPGLAFEPAGRRQLKGFGAPVPAVSVLRA